MCYRTTEQEREGAWPYRLPQKDTCFVHGGTSAPKSLIGGSTRENCFPEDLNKVNIAFNNAYVGAWGVFCFEWYLYLHILLAGALLWVPVELMPSECLKYFTIIFMFPPVIAHFIMALVKHCRKGRGFGRND